jgi:hypothetical protein
MELPATSAVTAANFAASVRQTFAGADSKPEGPGVSSSCLRKVNESLEVMLGIYWVQQGSRRWAPYLDLEFSHSAKVTSTCQRSRVSSRPNTSVHVGAKATINGAKVRKPLD